ncbi:hypothetical protein MTATph1_CDS0231 [Moorella phage MTATph1]
MITWALWMTIWSLTFMTAHTAGEKLAKKITRR